MTIIIGLLGPAGAGKSTAAEYLVEKYDATRYSLAKPLKEMAKRVLGFSDEQVYGTQEQKERVDPRFGFSARHFLQRLGTEGIRETFGPDVWVDLLLRKVSAERPKIAVVDDVRFVSETIAIQSTSIQPMRGMIWRLENPERETTADATHASEAEWKIAPYDFAIAPIGRGLKQLYALLDDACAQYRIFPLRPEMRL